MAVEQELPLSTQVEGPLGDGGFAHLPAGSWLDLDRIRAFFDEVPRDPYVPEGFRFKSIARVRVHDGAVERGPHEPLFQDKAYNPVHGDIHRRYDPIAEPLLEALGDAIRLYWTCARVPAGSEILVQAQRVTASAGPDGDAGLPAVEGFHQDNVELVGILVVNRVNIRGGVTLLSNGKDIDEAVFGGELHPGDLLLLDDRRVFHNTTPIHRHDPSRPGYRDVVLFGWPSARQSE